MTIGCGLAVAATATFLAPAPQAPAATVPVGQIPATSATARGFAPPGWRVEKSVRGDLDRDGDGDVAIVLIQDPTAGAAYGVNDGSRGLVLALRQATGTLRRAGVAPRLLGCRQCGGAFWGLNMPVSVAIRGGDVVVRQEFGSRELTSTVHRIRWLPGQRRLRLIGLDTTVLDRLTLRSTEVSTNHMTRRQIRTRRDGNRIVSRTSRLVAVSPRPIAGLVFGSTRP
jgi:hypothetical protein